MVGLGYVSEIAVVEEFDSSTPGVLFEFDVLSNSFDESRLLLGALNEIYQSQLVLQFRPHFLIKLHILQELLIPKEAANRFQEGIIDLLPDCELELLDFVDLILSLVL